MVLVDHFPIEGLSGEVGDLIGELGELLEKGLDLFPRSLAAWRVDRSRGCLFQNPSNVGRDRNSARLRLSRQLVWNVHCDSHRETGASLRLTRGSDARFHPAILPRQSPVRRPNDGKKAIR